MANTITTKAKTRQEIADLFGISADTLRRRLKENGITLPRGLVFTQQQKLVFDALGYPDASPKEAFEDYG